MTNADFLNKLGLFTVKKFLDADLCQKLQSEVDSAAVMPTTVRKKDSTYIVDESFRKVKQAEVSLAAEKVIKKSLVSLKPKLEDYFNLELTDFELPQFLVYKKGDFYRSHIDNSSDDCAPEWVKNRKVSIVLFLNNEAEKPEKNSYNGGNLTFYNLINKSSWKQYGFPLISEAGLLIAFRSDTVHEVSPVTYGRRYTVVSWFF